MEISIGNIYWLITESKISHPHVVIRINDDETVVVCSITTNTKKMNMPGVVVLEIGEGNLEKESIVEVYKQFTVSQSELGEYIGTLKTDRVEEVLRGIKFIEKSYLDKTHKL